jgi:hypothetical protein
MGRCLAVLQRVSVIVEGAQMAIGFGIAGWCRRPFHG